MNDLVDKYDIIDIKDKFDDKVKENKVQKYDILGFNETERSNFL